MFDNLNFDRVVKFTKEEVKNETTPKGDMSNTAFNNSKLLRKIEKKLR